MALTCNPRLREHKAVARRTPRCCTGHTHRCTSALPLPQAETVAHRLAAPRCRSRRCYQSWPRWVLGCDVLAAVAGGRFTHRLQRIDRRAEANQPAVGLADRRDVGRVQGLGPLIDAAKAADAIDLAIGQQPIVLVAVGQRRATSSGIRRRSGCLGCGSGTRPACRAAGFSRPAARSSRLRSPSLAPSARWASSRGAMMKLTHGPGTHVAAL